MRPPKPDVAAPGTPARFPAGAADAFLPSVAALGEGSPSPYPRATLWIVTALLGALAAWSAIGRIDAVAVAEGRLVPRSQLRIVQPAEGGVLRELLVAEGQRVRAGQLLARMDMRLAQADAEAVATDLALRRLQLRRIQAELDERPLARGAVDEPPELFAQVEAQREARVRAYRNSLAEERAVVAKARREMSAAQETRAKLAAALPLLREHEVAFERLAKEGFAGKLMLHQRSRERVEAEQDLRAQEHRVQAAAALIEQSERRMSQLQADYRARLQTERVEAERERSRLEQAAEKLRHRAELSELRAPADGVVKELATHTAGSVLAPGAVLMTLVPDGEPLTAEVWLPNQDAGLVQAGQAAKIKLSSFPFQRYGMLEGRVLRVSADAIELGAPQERKSYAYRAHIELASQQLRSADAVHELRAGMQLTAEIRLADRTVLEYVLSPVQRVASEAGRER